MTRSQTFPSVLIGLQLCAAVLYAFELDVRHAVYWLAAAVLGVVVTF